MAAITRLTGMAIPGALGASADFAGKEDSATAGAGGGGFGYLGRRRRYRFVAWLTWMCGL